MLVQEPDRRYALRVLLLDLALFVAAVGSWVALPVLDGWWKVLAGVVVGFQLGRAGITSWRRAAAYRAGWLRGRQQMIASMTEAHNRGMTVTDWLGSELARDYAVLGITPEDFQKMQRERED
jgi:hypothetical protein